VGRHFLQIPGPTKVPDRVLRAIDVPTIDHRGPAFARLGSEVLDGMQEVFRTDGPVVIYPSIRAVTVVHHETSTGVTSRVPEIRAALDATGSDALSDTAGSIRRPAPLLGEHTAEVLREAGFADAEIAAL
jgi:aspartate aminotransferase-like enzyme